MQYWAICLVIFIFTSYASAQDSSSTPPLSSTPIPMVAPDVNEFEKLPPSKIVKETQDRVTSKSLKVEQEKDGFFKIKTPNRAYPPGTLILFMRPSRTGLDMLAQGIVDHNDNSFMYVKLNMLTVDKVPYAGDVAVPIAPAWAPEKKSEPAPVGFIPTEPEPEPGDPGHIQLDYGFLMGSLQTQTTSQANAYKKVPQFRVSHMHFEWYFQFLWNLGLEFESYTGEIPSSSYYRAELTTTEAVRAFMVNYRFRRMFNDTFRPTFRLISINDKFETDNTDEAIISSSYSSMGGGFRWAYEFTSNVWKPESRSLDATLHRVYLDTNFYPIISAKDLDISRGANSSGSMGYEWRLGVTGLAWIDYVPFFKRFVLEAFYGQRTYMLKFSGATKSETGGVYTIPAGGTSTESISYYVIYFGVRLDDFIGKVLMPR